jgi:nitrogenase molybdenum-iron protein beta chain
MTHTVLKNPRQGCELHGALRTVEALSGAAPVVHANSGCVYQHYLASAPAFSTGGTVYGPEVPATEVIEKQIVFGGASRLREQIKNTAKVIKGDLYVILGSCESAMVGDDLAAMTKEARDAGIPAVFFHSAGFRGGSHDGYAGLMKALIKQLPSARSGETIPGLVNVLGIVPGEDPFFKGNLLEIKNLLEQAGLRVNVFFGPGSGVAELEQSRRAEHTLVFSRWGLPAAEELQEQYGIPCAVFESLPLGLDGTEQFYQSLSRTVHIDDAACKTFLAKERDKERYFFKALSHAWYAGALQKSVVLAGDLETVRRFASFLRQTLGMVILRAIITDGPAEMQAKLPVEEIFFTSDSGEIAEIAADAEPELILGSALEAPMARRLGIPLMVIASPAGNIVPLHKTYAGIGGAYFFLEDYAEAAQN